MNARSQTFELTVEGRQIEEVVLSLFHTLLFHRTTGKFQYKQEGTYSIGTIGMVELDCDYTDFSYIRCDSAELDAFLKKEVSGFRDILKSNDGLHSGQISLEFYEKKKNRWPFPDESIPWEVWTLIINVVTLTNEHERQAYREKLGELLGEKVICVVEAMNRHDYLPKAPNQPLLDTVFNTSFSDVQPYLFKISYQNSGPTNASVGTAVRKLVRDTLAL
ncbi:autophagy-related protein 101-like [Lytechinus pictus]|uniref:autophagy-related protein 101-like n=1 Tax=Lytechinus pictus TaxID=7653 RepID=UPI00240DFB13|nr:autophagy-related protein 101-like [Lytechinus pictus]XP_054757576.1 autophagy-related protein 101-like [Lytechinus pictus]